LQCARKATSARCNGPGAGLVRIIRPVAPFLVTNPASDSEFRAVVHRLVTAGADRPEVLQRLLRDLYPLAVVRVRAISGEQVVTWYVYRDGRWSPSQ
jgi:hypothetical protein